MTSLSYELAKALKDAGWPQKAIIPDWGVYDAEGNYTGRALRPSYYAPSLSELIAACPRTLTQTDDHDERYECEFTLCAADAPGWLAHYDPDPGVDLYGRGATPEEATARLWLKLQESKP